jgi:glycosyltransferase involved in cell wall biosynthesis
MTIGSFTLVKNEIPFILEHIKLWEPHLDQMVFFDGNSTDGTLEVIKSFKSKKIKVYENSDPIDTEHDYVKKFDECLKSLDTDLAIFLHPDMMPVNGEELKNIPENIIAATVNISSFAGDPGGKLYEVKSGRGGKWKNIYRLNNPNIGAHYYGFYGETNEDVYFKEITGNQHFFYGQNFSRYEYPIYDCPLQIKHYSDVRPYKFRLERMVKCLRHQGVSEERILMAPTHPRVSLKDGQGFEFVEVDKPAFLKEGIKA